MSNCLYVIVPVASLTQQMVDDSIQTSMETVRKSIDGTNAVLKYCPPQPASLSGYTEYTHAEILPIVQGVDWEPTD